MGVCHLANPGSTESQSPSHCSLARSTLTTTLSPTSTLANVAVNSTRLSVPTQGVTTCSSPSSTPTPSSSTWQRAQECGWTDPSTSLCPTNTALTCTAMASRKRSSSTLTEQSLEITRREPSLLILPTNGEEIRPLVLITSGCPRP